jgi:hypothetical protein
MMTTLLHDLHLIISIIVIIFQAASQWVVVWRQAPATVVIVVVVPSAAKRPLRGVFVEVDLGAALIPAPCSIFRQQLIKGANVFTLPG